jgi:hypothetical protein
MNHLLNQAPVGTRVWFPEYKRPYRIRARDGRYIVLTQPFNLRRTVLYTIIDLAEGVRGPENLIFGQGAETDEQCEAIVRRLNGSAAGSIRTEVSRRNRVSLRVTRVEEPTHV